MFDDGISVKEQRENRQSNKQKLGTIKESWPRAKEISERKKVRKKVITDVVLLETPAREFEYIISPIEPEGNLVFPQENCY